MKKALAEAKNPKSEEGILKYEDTVSWATGFFRIPKQIQWIVEKTRNIARSGVSEIEILSVGCSYGMEPVSILIALMEDYEQNKKDWGNFDVLRRVKIRGADIDLRVLRYMRRGQFNLSHNILLDELDYLHEHCLEFGLDTKVILHKYFDVDKTRNTFTLKSRYQAMLSADYMDVLDPESMDSATNRLWIIVYNNVDFYLGPESQVYATQNLGRLGSLYITTIYDQLVVQEGTRVGLEMGGYKITQQSGGLVLYKKD